MNFSQRILDFRILDNRLENILWLFGLLLLAFLFKRYISSLLGKLLYQFFRRFSLENRGKSFNRLLVTPVQWLLMFLIVSFGVELLRFPAAWNVHLMGHHLHALLEAALRVAIAVAFTWVLMRIVDFVMLVMADRAARTESKLDDQLVPFAKDAAKLVIVVFSVLFILGSVLHFNIASLIAGVGIGGLAIALAAQESLKNLFASITIFLDKPFSIGDLVTAGNVTGTVENVGFRSTRLRTADKTFVTLPNKVMVDGAVDNQTLRTERRVNIIIILGFDTTLDQIRSIVADLDTFFKQHAETKNSENVVRFDDFTANGFRLNIVYFVPTKPFAEFMLTREEVNFKIVEVVQRNKASFAKSLHQVEMLPVQIQNQNGDATVRR